MELNYHHLRYFRAVAHDGNLTRAAAKLNLSQSALSVQIRALEDRLGQPLFDRRGRQLHLTEAGRIALDHADTIFAAGDDLLSALSGVGAARQTVRVGAQSTLSRNFQLGFLRPLLGRDDTGVVLRAGSTRELLDGLETLALDVVLTNVAPAQDRMSPFVVHPLGAQTVGLFGTPDRLAAPDLATLLAREPVILPTESTIRAGFDSLVARLGLSPRIAAEVDDMAMVRLLAREAAGLALVPAVVLRDELAAGLLAEAPFPLDISESFYAVTIARRFPNPLLRDLLENARTAERRARSLAGAGRGG
ncbi:MAG: LysR family transcriptional regulator [Limimaricola sp.]|uniref:LysR family transcriptional regulator n=1 Tax=Limimaricola sp. TaxID=2211665 RepID=UPI001E1887F8|nr:LysR family transcriptional regulator [Limimaricola sp.]MBI1418262.1 LysR family transcriptional regulator [Limimaricola sp.]